MASLMTTSMTVVVGEPQGSSAHVSCHASCCHRITPMRDLITFLSLTDFFSLFKWHSRILKWPLGALFLFYQLKGLIPSMASVLLQTHRVITIPPLCLPPLLPSLFFLFLCFLHRQMATSGSSGGAQAFDWEPASPFGCSGAMEVIEGEIETFDPLNFHSKVMENDLVLMHL